VREVEGPLATVFYTNGWEIDNQCHHSKDPCIHAYNLKEIEPGLYTVEIDKDVKDCIIERWEKDLEKYGWKILQKIDTSSGEAQWYGETWILRRPSKELLEKCKKALKK